MEEANQGQPLECVKIKPNVENEERKETKFLASGPKRSEQYFILLLEPSGRSSSRSILEVVPLPPVCRRTRCDTKAQGPLSPLGRHSVTLSWSQPASRFQALPQLFEQPSKSAMGGESDKGGRRGHGRRANGAGPSGPIAGTGSPSRPIVALNYRIAVSAGHLEVVNPGKWCGEWTAPSARGEMERGLRPRGGRIPEACLNCWPVAQVQLQ